VKKIGYLIAHSEHVSPEEGTAWKFLLSCNQFNNSFLPLAQLSINSSTLKTFPVLWWHYDSSAALPPAVLGRPVIETLRSYVKRGGSLFLSLLAAQYVVDLGVEEVRPNIIEKGQWKKTCWAEKYPDIRGLSSFQGHPIFAGLHGAAFTWSPKPESKFSGAFYEAPAWPKNGRVVGVEREYIKLNEDWRVAVEYKLGKGKILTVGSFMFFADEKNRFRPHLELFTTNCLEYLSVHPVKGIRRPPSQRAEVAPQTQRTFWTPPARTVKWIQRK